SSGTIAFRHAIIREAVLDATVPHLVDTLHRRAAAALARGTDLDADALERSAHHLAAVGEHDAAATALIAAADRWRENHALLASERAARLARDEAKTAPVRAAADDALAGALSAQGRWIEAYELDEATVAAHGD